MGGKELVFKGGLQVGSWWVGTPCPIFTTFKEKTETCAHNELGLSLFKIIEVEWERGCAWCGFRSFLNLAIKQHSWLIYIY